MKLLILPIDILETSIVFIADMVRLLKEKGWQIMDSSDIKTDNMLFDMSKVGVKTCPTSILFYIVGLKHLNIWRDALNTYSGKIALLAEDLNNKSDIDVIKNADKYNIQTIFARYPEATKTFQKKIKIIPFYHAAMDAFFVKSIPFDKKQDACLLSGAIAKKYYKLREVLYKNIDNEIVVQRVHPGYDTEINPYTEATNYAKDINKYKMALSDFYNFGTKKNVKPYILAKHFEIPAANTVMITDKECTPFLYKLGFVSKGKNQNYIATTPQTILHDIDFWLKPENKTRLNQITKRGHELVKKHHTMKKRIDFLDSQL